MREALAVLTELERDRLVSEEMTEEIPDEEEEAIEATYYVAEEKAYAQMQWNQLVLVWVLSINGRKFHDLIMDNRTEIETNLSNALVDMDAKCGNFDKAVDLFNAIHPSERNASSWNILISGCGIDCQSALKVVSQINLRKNIVRDANRQGLLPGRPQPEADFGRVLERLKFLQLENDRALKSNTIEGGKNLARKKLTSKTRFKICPSGPPLLTPGL
ncbi:hypothetical protein OIU84_007321 [Salix udensis]|uniref:Pentatricopeptide repeat-containing protein n=1 Tax=Salix udensis TaxID=889485 RepID=A0AAD6NZA7_9ROSI|nr:hypothetical protein OIU84_007321 [Salix udensis]